MKARFLPANRVKAGSLKLGRLSVRTSDNDEIGKLVGFEYVTETPTLTRPFVCAATGAAHASNTMTVSARFIESSTKTLSGWDDFV